jgi:hypothetical protein
MEMNTLYELFALSHLYLNGGVGYVQEVPERPASSPYKWDQNRVANPLGIFAMGYEWETSRTLTTKMEYRHQSFIGVDDLGQDSIQLTVTWRPFKR